MSKIINGKEIAQGLRNKIKQEISDLKRKLNIQDKDLQNKTMKISTVL